MSTGGPARTPESSGVGSGAGSGPTAPGGWLRRHETVTVTGLSLLAFVALWEAVARFGGLGPAVFAGPGAVLRVLAELTASGEIFRHVGATSIIFLGGFALASVVGVVVGLALGSNDDLEAIFRPYLMALYAAPRVAFISLLLIWLGFGARSGIALVFLSAVFPIVINTLAGARSVEGALLKTARSFGATRLRLFTKVVLPYSVPYILAGLRLGVGRGLIGAFVAEMFGARVGIGYLIIRAGLEYQPATLLAGILVLAALSLTLTEGLRWAAARLAPWQRETAF